MKDLFDFEAPIESPSLVPKGYVKVGTSRVEWTREIEPSPSMLSMLDGVHDVLLTGSRFIDPAGPFEDIDICLLAEPTLIFGDDWDRTRDYEGDMMFTVRKGIINFIVLYDPVMFSKWVLATEVCKSIAKSIKMMKMTISPEVAKASRKAIFRRFCGEPE